MKFYNYYIFFVLLFVISCSDDKPTPHIVGRYEPGVVLTFDDDYITEWSAVHEILKPFNWKATFFVTKFNMLESSEIVMLQNLKYYGHEIGGHGINHLNAVGFINSNGIQGYMENEIYPMKNLMAQYGISVKSFAYPFGARTVESDNALLNEFSILRGTTYGNLKPDLHNCYYTGSPMLYGLGLDNSYHHYSVPYFLSLLDYARVNNKIVIFYAHKPVETASEAYQAEYHTLLEICNYVKTNNMKFYTASDLVGLW